MIKPQMIPAMDLTEPNQGRSYPSTSNKRFEITVRISELIGCKMGFVHSKYQPNLITVVGSSFFCLLETHHKIL